MKGGSIIKQLRNVGMYSTAAATGSPDAEALEISCIPNSFHVALFAARPFKFSIPVGVASHAALRALAQFVYAQCP